ncbi:MAG: zinc ribbon domain-containing protein [Candidatus Binataceae bacterium]
MFCPKCAVENRESAIFCVRCGAPLDTRVVVVRSAKSPGLAAVLSFLWCGLGQIYNGEIGKGVAMLAAYMVSVILIFVVIGLITTPILWIWGMIDAYNTAERLNRDAGVGAAL